MPLLISAKRRTPFPQPKRKLANATVSVLVLVRTRYLHTGVRTLSTRYINRCLQQLFTLNDTWGFCEDRDNFLMLSFISRVIDVCTQKTLKAVCWLSLVWLNQANTICTDYILNRQYVAHAKGRHQTAQRDDIRSSYTYRHRGKTPVWSLVPSYIKNHWSTWE